MAIELKNPSAPYEGCKVYGPYIRKGDGRKHVIVHYPNGTHVTNGTRITVSYPKYLVECKLGRFINTNEEIHHKDEDFTNDNLDNLEIKDSSKHRSDHVIKYFPETWICVYCEESFDVTARQVRNRAQGLRLGRIVAGPYCSKSCQGIVHN